MLKLSIVFGKYSSNSLILNKELSLLHYYINVVLFSFKAQSKVRYIEHKIPSLTTIDVQPLLARKSAKRKMSSFPP